MKSGTYKIIIEIKKREKKVIEHHKKPGCNWFSPEVAYMDGINDAIRIIKEMAE